MACFVYRCSNGAGSSVIGLLFPTTESLSVTDQKVFNVVGDPNVCNREWPEHFSETPFMEREADFAEINNLPQAISLLTRVPDRAGDPAYTLGLSLTSISPL